MSMAKRVDYFVEGLLMLVAVGVMLYDVGLGYELILMFLSVMLLSYSVRQFFYYFIYARYMVGGNLVLLKAVVTINLGFQAWHLTDVPRYYVMIYLVFGLIFSGLVDVLRAMETRKQNGVGWKLKLAQGIITILIAITGLIFINSAELVVYIYCIGLVSSAITKITESFRKTAVIYIS